jgi:predicted molibdopterin-dependent oxidoreductase YjgC
LAVLLGADWSYATVGGVLAEMAQAIPLYAGMSFDQLARPVPLSRRMSHYIYAGMSFQAEVREGIQWATRAEREAAILELGWIDPEAPRANLASPARGASQAAFTLVTPRVLYDGGTLLGQAEILGTRLVRPYVALARTDAQALGISDGDTLLVSTNGTSVTLPAYANGLVPQGVVAIPRNLEGRPAESLLGEGHTFGQVQVTIKR